jgi:hypothetical protein
VRQQLRGIGQVPRSHCLCLVACANFPVRGESSGRIAKDVLAKSEKQARISQVSQRGLPSKMRYANMGLWEISSPMQEWWFSAYWQAYSEFVFVHFLDIGARQSWPTQRN